MYEIYCKLRDKKRLKDADVVKATGITKSTFSDWKSGRSKPKQDKLQRIADFLEVSVDYLFMTGKKAVCTAIKDVKKCAFLPIINIRRNTSL